MFQSTRPCGARHLRLRRHRAGVGVSIHAPVRGATGGAPVGAGRAGVSIHAPVRGATRRQGRVQLRRVVSIHAPVRGATGRRTEPAARKMGFNPRARAGRDRRSCCDVLSVCDVSIHAPVRGATHFRGYLLRVRMFQSTRPCGARRAQELAGLPGMPFQSTRPCGARPCWQWPAPRPWRRFNPRARAGRDPSTSSRREVSHMVSIHAPVRGATASM